ncbi:MAG: N-acetylmuramoyl-L-alanine amidase family protein, partial [Paracoccaceae bacterium]
VDRAGMTVDPATQAATLSIRLKRTEQAAFDATAGAPAAVGVSEGVSEDVAAALSSATGPKGADVAGDLFADQAPRRILRVMLDPGHGGIDPGAQRDGINESALMLAMARDVQEVLRRAGGFEVILTRDADVFVSLDKRVSMAQRAGADVFISLHADALAEGRAEGATIYTLSEEASDKASAALAARHDRSEILSGVNLGGTGADVAEALLDLARQETQPRADRLAAQMVLGIETSVGRVNARPLRRAGFSVLKSADIPSVLIEVGFLSTQADLRALQDPQWRERFATGIRDGLQAWALDDAARQAVQRQ